MEPTTTRTERILGSRRTLLKNGLSSREETGRSSRRLVSVGCHHRYARKTRRAPTKIDTMTLLRRFLACTTHTFSEMLITGIWVVIILFVLLLLLIVFNVILFVSGGIPF